MSGKSNTQPKSYGRRLQLEPLERRCMLSLTAYADLDAANVDDGQVPASDVVVVAKALPTSDASDTSCDCNGTSGYTTETSPLKNSSTTDETIVEADNGIVQCTLVATDTVTGDATSKNTSDDAPALDCATDEVATKTDSAALPDEQPVLISRDVVQRMIVMSVSDDSGESSATDGTVTTSLRPQVSDDTATSDQAESGDNSADATSDVTNEERPIICYIGPQYQVDAGTDTSTNDGGEADTSSTTPQNTDVQTSDVDTGVKPADTTDAQPPVIVFMGPVKETIESELPASPDTCDAPTTGDDPVVVDHFGGIKTDDGSTTPGGTGTLHPMNEGTDTDSTDVTTKGTDVPVIYTLGGDAGGPVVPTTTGATAGHGKHRHEAKGKVLLPIHHDEALTGLLSGTNNDRKAKGSLDDLFSHHGHKVAAHLAHVDQVMAGVLDNPVNKHAKHHG